MELGFPTSIPIAVCLIALSACGPSEQELRLAKEKAQIELLKQKVADSTNDPMSAQFRNLKFIGENKGLCGEINYKGNTGGYVGFKVFGVASDVNPVILEHLPAIEMPNLAKKSKEEREAYIQRFVAQFLMLGQREKAVGLAVDLVNLPNFKNWGECYSG